MPQQASPTTLTSPLLPGCEAWVTVDGTPLSVYSAQVDGSKSSGYIEAVEGAHFEIKYREGREQPPANDYIAQAYLDGRWVRGLAYRRTSSTFTEPLDSPSRIDTLSSAKISSTSERPFLFSKLLLTDNEDLACNDEEVIKSMGTIQLRIYRVKDVRRDVDLIGSREFPDHVLHEQTKKAQLSHQTSLGPLRTHEQRKPLTCTEIDSSSSPYCAFEFRYRSRALLELEGHAPASPAPAPAPPIIAAQDSPPPPIKAPPASENNKNKNKRPIKITIESDDKDDGLTELERLRARVAELEIAERERVKVEPGVKVKEENESSLQKIKKDKSSSSGGSGSNSGGKKGKPEVIELD